jgi:hypothetical protein
MREKRTYVEAIVSKVCDFGAVTAERSLKHGLRATSADEIPLCTDR